MNRKKRKGRRHQGSFAGEEKGGNVHISDNGPHVDDDTAPALRHMRDSGARCP